LEYALDDLEHHGVVLLSDTEGCYLGDPEYEELFAELDRRGAVVFIHPHDDPGETRRYDIFSPLLEWPVHTTRAVMDLLYTGRLARYPNIRYILAHGGGAVPYLAHRIASGLGLDEPKHAGNSVVGGDLEIKPPSSESLEQGLGLLKRLYYDTGSPGKAHLAALQEFVGPEKMVFGTDGGWTPPIQTAQTINEVMDYDGFDQAQLRAVERGNALELFPRLAPSERVLEARSA
jgi:predicted TIM-barrel fold metal-dependent hydrolase